MDELARLSGLLGGEPRAAVLAGAALLARLGAAAWIAPFMGGRLVPAVARVGVALALAGLLYPGVVRSVTVPAGPWPLILGAVVVKEAMVGFALGFVAGLAFWAARVAGRLGDTARGASLAEALVPQEGDRSSVMGSLLFQLSVVLFFALGGHRVFLLALGSSFEVLPVTAVPAGPGVAAFAQLCARLTADVLGLGLALAAPLVATALLTDLTLGVVNRFAPQINVFFLAMPAKAALGVAVLALAVGLVLAALPPVLDQAMAQVSRALGVLGG